VPALIRRLMAPSRQLEGAALEDAAQKLCDPTTADAVVTMQSRVRRGSRYATMVCLLALPRGLSSHTDTQHKLAGLICMCTARDWTHLHTRPRTSCGLQYYVPATLDTGATLYNQTYTATHCFDTCDVRGWWVDDAATYAHGPRRGHSIEAITLKTWLTQRMLPPLHRVDTDTGRPTHLVLVRVSGPKLKHRAAITHEPEPGINTIDQIATNYRI
jgi:hypothetical protein